MKAFLLFLAALFGVSLGHYANAAEARKYRWFPRMKNPFSQLVPGAAKKKSEAAFPIVVPLEAASGAPTVVSARGELIQSGAQKVGGAILDGTWTQTIFRPDGEIIYAAGAVFDELPGDEWLARLRKMQSDKAAARRSATSYAAKHGTSTREIDGELRLRKKASGAFEAYWRFEYPSSTQEQIHYLEIGEGGEVLGAGELAVPGADGRARVFPLGPKWSPVTEVPLHQLNGDGTLTSRFFRITSALGLDASSPNLLFFFPENDRRFDLSQVYFTMEKSLKWMHDFLGVELKAPLEVRLHIGNNGVSNAAFYHKDVIYLGTGDGEIYQNLPRDPSVVIHESMHALIDAYSGLPSEGEGGSFNEGFADLFTALLLKNPHMADSSYLKAPFRRTVANELQAHRDFSEGTYQNGSIIAGTFWDMRSFLDDQKLARLAFHVLTRLGAGARFEDFALVVSQAADELLTADEARGVASVLRARNWLEP